MCRAFGLNTSLPLLMAYMACSPLASHAADEARLAAEAPEVAQAVTLRIEGSVPRSVIFQQSLSCGTKAAFIAMLGILVLGMLILVRGFHLSSTLMGQSACVAAAALLACGGIAAASALIGHPKYQLASVHGAKPLSDTVGDLDNTYVYIAVVEGEGSPSHNLHRGKHLLLQTSIPKEEVSRGSRLYLTLDSDDPGELETASNAPSVTAH